MRPDEFPKYIALIMEGKSPLMSIVPSRNSPAQLFPEAIPAPMPWALPHSYPILAIWDPLNNLPKCKIAILILQ